jgi:hypothetical protein
MKVLAKENEYAILLEEANINTEQIYHYGKLLAGKYPTPVREIFVKQLNKDAESANSREAYGGVCSHILCFAEAGYYAEAVKMIAEFKIKFKRKPAFVDELIKIEEN